LEDAAAAKPQELAMYLFIRSFSLNSQVIAKSTITPENPTPQNFANFNRRKLSIFIIFRFGSAQRYIKFAWLRQRTQQKIYCYLCRLLWKKPTLGAMNVRILTYLCAAVTAFFAHATIGRCEISVFPTGARSAAIGGAAVTTSDIFAVYNNQAALGFVDNATAAMHYKNLYLLPDLNIAAAAFAMPVPYAGTAGISVCTFGGQFYNELRTGIGIGKRLGSRFAVGAQVNYTRITVEGYGSTGAITAEAGILAYPVENLRLGAHVYNFTYSKFLSREYNVSLPVIFNIGAGYRVVDDVDIFLQSEFYSGRTLRCKAGIEYRLLRDLALRAGATIKPVELAMGAGYTLHGLTIDFAFARHQALGYSPQISIIYAFGK
jgi:hypothetical protein